MYKKGLRITACSIASAVVLAGTTIATGAAPIAGVSGMTAVEGEATGSLVAGVSLAFSNYLSSSEEVVAKTAADAPVVAAAEEQPAAEPVAEPEPVVESEYANVAIAQVDNYVNIRSAATEDGEVLGKLYNNSAATVLGEENGWYQITSGTVTGYVKSEYVVRDNAELAKSVSRRVASVTTTTLNVRTEPSTEAELLTQVPVGDDLTVIDESTEGWSKVTTEAGEGYVSNDYVSLSTEYVQAESKAEEEARLAKEEAERVAAQEAAEAKAAAAAAASASSSSASNQVVADAATFGSDGVAVANYAAQFVGNPYVAGGTSLTNGADCSGFIMSVYAAFGVFLPHSSAAMRSCGYEVSTDALQPGDIICYSGHVALYVGNNTVVHASTPATGIKYTSPITYKQIITCRRIF